MLTPLAAGANATGPTALVADLMADDLPWVPTREGLASRSAARCPRRELEASHLFIVGERLGWVPEAEHALGERPVLGRVAQRG